MTRYLTPSKIGLLALAAIYTESVVPASATIPILTFLTSHLLPLTLDSDRHFLHKNTNITLDAIRLVTESHASGIPGRTVWDLLLNKLWRIDSLDALHVFFEQLPLLLQSQAGQEEEPRVKRDVLHRIRLSRRSPLGGFVRRAQLEFARLQFHDGVALWHSLVGFRLPSLPHWRKRNPHSDFTGIDINLDQEQQGIDTPVGRVIYEPFLDQGDAIGSFSTEEAERLLEYQVNQIQSKS